MQFARERERERNKERGCCESSSLHIELGPQYMGNILIRIIISVYVIQKTAWSAQGIKVTFTGSIVGRASAPSSVCNLFL